MEHKTMHKILTELEKRLKLSRHKVINVEIALANNCTASLGTIAKDFAKDISELDRMVKSLKVILERGEKND